MRKVHLLRHGATRASEESLYCGATDIPLSAKGEAALLEMRKNRDYPDISGCIVVTSGMRRADETLKALYGSVGRIALPGLKEMNFGEFEMRSYAELCGDPAYLEWITGDNAAKRCPGGESGIEMRERSLRCFNDLFSSCGNDLLIVTHGGVISTLMDSFFPGSGRNFYEWQPRNGVGYTVSFILARPESWTVLPGGRGGR